MFGISGTEKLLKNMDALGKAAKNKVAKKAITEGVKLAAKIVKQSIPGKYKGVRKSIGYSFKKPRSGKFKDIVFAKAGAGAGMSKKKREKTTTKVRGGRKGVGFDARNIHWWFLGTQERTTGTKRTRRGGKRGRRGWRGVEVRVDTGKTKRNTGRMPAQSAPISVIVNRSSGEINKVIRTWIANGIKVEAGK